MIDPNSTGDVIDQTTIDPVIDQNAPNESDASSALNDVTNEGQDDGVNWKNKFFETDRKLQNLNKSIPQMIQEAAQKSAQEVSSQVQKQQQPEYSVNDYLTAKLRDPQNAPFYESKIAELNKREIESAVTQKLTEFERNRQAENARQQADAWAVTNFPQLRDPNNAFSQAVWNTFNSRPAEKREPHDFALATELVASRMGIKPVTAVNTSQDKLNQKEREVKKLMKERAIEGDGRGRSSVTSISQRQADAKAALDGGDLKGYISKYWIKPKAAEE